MIYSLGFITPKYESKTKLLLATNSSEANVENETITTTDVTLNSKLVSTYSELVKSNKVIRSVISNLAISEEEENIRKNVSVNAVSDTEVIEIKVKNEDPVIAAKITNEIAKVFIENVKEYYGIENVRIVDEAEVDEKPCNINHTKNMLIAAIIGLILASMYAIIINMLDTTVKSVEEIEKITGVTVLVSIPTYETLPEERNKKSKGGVKRK